jgi:hypothetical protein
VQRQTLASEEQFALAPPRGASPYSEGARGGLIAELGDEDIPRPATHPEGESWNADEGVSFAGSSSAESVVVTESAPAIDMDYSSGSGGSYSRPREPTAEEIKRAEQEKARLKRIRDKRVQGQQRVKQVADSLKSSNIPVVIEGNAGAGETQAQALDRANVLRNQLIDQGVPPAQLTVRAVDAEEGRPAGVRLLAERTGDDGKAALADDSPVGESHFQSSTPMSVQRGASVMVSIVNENTDGDVVYLYDAESARGNNRYAFKAVRLLNPTKNTLDTGPVTVYGDGKFIGEGLTEPIPPEAVALVPFALDRQVVVEPKVDMFDRIASLVTLQRGVLTTEVQHTRKTTLKIKNRRRVPVKVYIRHTVQRGWSLVDAPDDVERLGNAHLFPITLKGDETRTLTIAEATPLTQTLDLRSPASLDMVDVFLSDEAAAGGVFAKQMKQLLALHKQISDDELAIDSLRERMGDYRERMDELHVQIVSLKAVKTGGTLMKHLKTKLKEISDRVQEATIKLVDHQESMMMARIQFLDAVSELTMEKRALAAVK